MSDRHIRRSGDDYAEALAALLPVGAAWPREHDSVLMRVVRALAQAFGFVDRRAAELLERESDPRAAIDMLSDWERNWGLPDPCFGGDVADIERRRALLLLKMTIEGEQSRAFFYGVAAWLGYAIEIREFSPFMCGVSRCGETAWMFGERFHRWEIGPPEMRFYWTIRVGQPSLRWFRAGSGQAGVDPHLRISLALDLECLFRRWKPAHTEIVFDYSGLAIDGAMAGTP